MTNLEKIRSMEPEVLSKFVTQLVHSTEVDYDYDERAFERTVDVWVTPFATYPGWWSEDDVIEEVTELLLAEIPEGETE